MGFLLHLYKWSLLGKMWSEQFADVNGDLLRTARTQIDGLLQMLCLSMTGVKR